MQVVRQRLGLTGGWSCVVAGVTSHLVFGSVYCWSNFQSYAPPRLKFFDGSLTRTGSPDLLLVFPLALVSQCFAMPFGTILVKKIGSRTSLILGVGLVSAGVFLSSYAQDLVTFILCYAILYGTGIGIGYTAAMIAGWKWMPTAKGLVSGSILAGFGSGGFIFNMVGTHLANPNGLNPIKGHFPPEVHDNFPGMLRTLACIYVTMGLVGSLFVVEAPPDANDETSPPSPGRCGTRSSSSGSSPTTDLENAKGGKDAEAALGVSVEVALGSPQFWLMWWMIVTSACAGLNVATVYKQFAAVSPALAGDKYQSLVGGLGALANGLGRIFWGTLCDKIGFKHSFALLTLVQSLIHAYYPSVASSKTAFLFFTSLSFFFLAGNFSLMPPSVLRLFGPKNGSLLYGIIYSAFGVASIGTLFLNKHLIESLGFEGVFRILSLLSIVATMLTSQLVPIKSYPGSSI